jgi:hypothetical protein
MITSKSWDVLSSDIVSPDEAVVVSLSLFNRLLDCRNEKLRALVRGLAIEAAGDMERAEGL